MNFFRSEEHMRNWSQFNPNSIEGSLSLDDELTWANVEVAKHRLDGDYISQWANKQREQREEVAQRLGKSGLFWTR
tara:strand:+ start:12 stop:239 length:228 start_codon:yes stop_codon:yes gene_type:complete